jgi:DNA invertase Pin-like site-specific DNA recombinase
MNRLLLMSRLLHLRPRFLRWSKLVPPGVSLPMVVWRLDRLGRLLKHLIETITNLNNRKIGFKSIQENIDTTTSGGKLIFHIFGVLAEFERDIIRERTQAGLQAARARGRKGDRPKSLTDKRAAMAQELYNTWYFVGNTLPLH